MLIVVAVLDQVVCSEVTLDSRSAGLGAATSGSRHAAKKR